MANLITVLNHVSTPLKAAWMLWLLWSGVQIGWYRRFAAAVAAHRSEPGPRLEQRNPEPKVRHREEVKTASESRPRPAEPEKRFGGTFISLGLDDRRSASVDQSFG